MLSLLFSISAALFRVRSKLKMGNVDQVVPDKK